MRPASPSSHRRVTRLIRTTPRSHQRVVFLGNRTKIGEKLLVISTEPEAIGEISVNGANEISRLRFTEHALSRVEWARDDAKIEFYQGRVWLTVPRGRGVMEVEPSAWSERRRSLAYNDAIWTPALRQRALRESGAARQAHIALILRDPDALHRLVYRWDTFVAYCMRSERHPQIMARDPERIDAGLLELRATAVRIPRDISPKLHGVLAELEGIAERTRSFRQQCVRAQDRIPAEA